MTRLILVFLYSLLCACTGSASELTEETPRKQETPLQPNNASGLSLDPSPKSSHRQNTRPRSNTNLSDTRQIHPEPDFDKILANEEEFREAMALANRSRSYALEWNDEVKLLSEILYKNIHNTSKILEESLLSIDGQDSTDSSPPPKSNIIEVISDLVSEDHLSLNPNDKPSDTLYLSGSASPNIAVFVSFSIPELALHALIRDARISGVPVYLRGFKDGSLAETARQARAILPDSRSSNQNEDALDGFLIDPRAFKVFQVDRVPTFVAYQGSMPDCDNLYCEVAIPKHDRVAGNISLQSALEILSISGTIAPEQAKMALTRLEGDL